MGYFQLRTSTSRVPARSLRRNKAQRAAMQITVNPRRRAAAARGLTLCLCRIRAADGRFGEPLGETTDPSPRDTSHGESWVAFGRNVVEV